MMVSCLHFSFGVYIMGVSPLNLSKNFVIYGLHGCRVIVSILRNQGWFGAASDPFSMVLSSSLSQSDDMANFSGQSLTRGVHTV